MPQKSTSKRRAVSTGSRFQSKRPFPSIPLQEAVLLPQKLKELNGGNPWSPSDLASSMGKSAKTNSFYYLATAARDYGLTEGTRDTPKISLTELGRQFVYAGSPEEEGEALRAAFFKVPLFKEVYEYYNGATLPELKYLGNTLEAQFKLKPEFHEEFHRMYQANCQFILQYGALDSSRELAAGRTTIGTGERLVTLATPAKGSSLRAFVAMPFSEKAGNYSPGFFGEVLGNLITPAGVQAGFKVETARKDGSDVIQATIVNDLLGADLVIADLTDHNPNVLFELGMRMAFDKPVALIRAKGTGPIFDVDNMLRVFEYSPNLWHSTLENDIPELAKHLKATWECRNSTKTYLQILKEQ